MSDLKHILPGEPIPHGSLFHERRFRVANNLLGGFDKDAVLLDIGSGNCSQTEFFAAEIRSAFGIDLQTNRLPGVRRELLSRKVDNITLTGGNAEELPFKSGVFDCVTCFEMLEHVKNQEKTLSEINRVLKNGGQLLMTVPHRWWIFETHGADLPILPWNRVPLFSWLPKKLHDRWARARNYTRKEIKDLVESCGFSSLGTRLLTAPMDVVKNQKMQNFLRKSIFVGDTTRIPFFSSNIFIFAKKIS